MAVLVDTSVLIAAEREGSGLARLLESAGGEPVSLAAVSASELLHGVHRAVGAQRRARRERLVETVLGMAAVLPFDLPVARCHAALWADLARRGGMIGAHDMMIAATALTHELPLATRNLMEFRRVEGLELVTGW